MIAGLVLAVTGVRAEAAADLPAELVPNQSDDPVGRWSEASEAGKYRSSRYHGR